MSYPVQNKEYEQSKEILKLAHANKQTKKAPEGLISDLGYLHQ